MKNRTKLWTSFLTGSFLAIALLFSSVSFAKAKVVSEVNAAAGDIAATFRSSDLITEANATYKAYQNDDWLITYGGGGNKSIGANKADNGVNLKLGDNVNVMGFDSDVNAESKYYSAVISKTPISNVGKISLVRNTGSTGSASSTKAYLTYGDSFDSSFSLIQEISTVPTTTTDYTFSTLTGPKYYALVFYASGWFRLDSVVANFYVGENPRTLESISVSGTLGKTSYFVGETFDPTGLTVKANYDDESDKDVTDKCVFTPAVLSAGTPDILISYTEEEITKTHTLSGQVTVIERYLASLQITTNPAKMNYFVGDSFDPTGMVVKANYNLGDPVADYKGYDYSPKSAFTSEGSKEITISDLVDDTISTSLSVQVSEVPPITELFFSEYIEGSGNNRGLEIYNGTGVTVNLSNYSIKQFTNGSVTVSSQYPLTDSINNESTYTISNTQADSGMKDKANIKNNVVTTFTGNDAIGLYKNDVLIDLIGVIGGQAVWTGTAANGAAGSTENKTLVRTATTLGPNPIFTWSEWNCYPADTFTYFGSHTVNLVTPAYVTEALAYGETFLSQTSAGCTAQSLTVLEGVWGGLKTQYLALSGEAKNYFASLIRNENGNAVEHTLERYYYIITKYQSIDNFMVNSEGDLVFNLNAVDHANTANYPKIIAIIAVLVTVTLVSGIYLIVRKKHKKIR